MKEEIQTLFFDHGLKILSLIECQIPQWSPIDTATFMQNKQKILDELTLFMGCADAVGQQNYSKLTAGLRGIVRAIDGRNYDQFVLIKNAVSVGLSFLAKKLNSRVSIDDQELQVCESGLAQAIQEVGMSLQGFDDVEYYRRHMNQYFARENGRPPTVLIVDDDEDVRDAIGSLIGNIPFDIVESSNGHEAWTLIDSRLIDVVVSDFLMPLLNGLELIHRMKVERVSTPVILISGYRERLKSQNAIDLGAFAFFEKPFSLKNLELCILKAVGTRMKDSINPQLVRSQFAMYLQSLEKFGGSLPKSRLPDAPETENDLIVKRRLLDLLSEA